MQRKWKAPLLNNAKQVKYPARKYNMDKTLVCIRF